MTQKLYNLFNTKIGLINTNYEYLTQEQLNTEKERRLINTLKEELKKEKNIGKTWKLKKRNLN